MQRSTKLSLLYHNPSFRFLYLGQFISYFGTMVSSVALPYQIYQETHSVFMVGLLSLCQLLPLLITALWGGVIADRHHRKQLLLLSEGCLTLLCLLLAWNASTLTPHLALIFIVATAMSAITGLHRPAMDSIKQQILAPKDFMSAAGLSGILYGFGSIGGPAFGGWIIVHFNLPITYLIDAMTFIISIGCLLQISTITKPMPQPDQSVVAALLEGIQFAIKTPALLGSYVVDFTAMVCCMPTVLFPAIANHMGGATTLGLLYSSPAIGALTVSLLSHYLHGIKRHGATIAISAGLWATSILLFGCLIQSHAYLAVGCLILSGAFDQVSGLFRSTLWNEVIPTDFRARLAGIEMISYMSGPKLGDTQMGFMASLVGIPTAICLGSLLSMTSVATACRKLPDFWYYRSKL